MATFDGLSKEKAEEILGMSVQSGIINEAGHLVFTRENDSTFDAGDFTGIVSDVFTEQIAAALLTALPNAISGTIINHADMSGGNLSFAGLNAATLVNALIKVKISGNISIRTADLPAAPKANTFFRVRVQQGGEGIEGGGKTVTAVGFKQSSKEYLEGPLVDSNALQMVDILVFYFDGEYWYARNEMPNVTVV